jgi:hypothetical protein
LYSLQYNGESVITPGGISRQIVDGNSWVGNVFNGDVSQLLKNQGEAIFSSFKNGVYFNGDQLRGPGGIDLASVGSADQERLIVIEHNGQRVTGGHLAIALADGFGVKETFMSLKSPGEPASDLKSLWEVIKSQGYQFDLNRRSGVFPIVWMRGSGMLWAAGANEFEVRTMIERVYNRALKEGYLD